MFYGKSEQKLSFAAKNTIPSLYVCVCLCVCAMFMYESVVVVVHNTNQHCLKVARTAADAAAVLFILRICFNLFRNANRATKHLRSFSLTHTSTRTLSHTLFHTHTSQSQSLLARFYGSLSLSFSLGLDTCTTL